MFGCNPNFWTLKYEKSEFIKMSFRNANIKSESYCGCAYQHKTTINTRKNIIAVLEMNDINITFI